MYTDETPVAFCDPLPDEVDVAIIGGGVIGVSTAYYLASRGRKVFLCDKGRVAGEQSSRNWGWVRVNGRDDAETPLAIDSLNCWEELSNEIGPDLGFERRGIIELAETENDMAFFERWIGVARENRLDTKLLSAAEIDSLFPDAKGDWRGAMMTPSDARAEPFVAVPLIARAAQGRGALIREACAASTIETVNGRISGLVTEEGRVKAGAVLCAAGAWSSRFLRPLGIDLPQLAVRGTVARTEATPSFFDGAAGFSDIYVRRRRDGGYTVATGFTEHFIGASSLRHGGRFLPSLKSASALSFCIGADPTQGPLLRQGAAGSAASFERTRVLNPPPSTRALSLIRKNLDARLPMLKGANIVESWAGMIDAMPDVVPVMDSAKAPEGLFIATGFSGHGFGIGPGAGKAMAAMIVGDASGHDLSRFRLSRFSDGSPMVPGPGL